MYLVFLEGKIKSILNELCVFESNFYDGEGSARMVCESLFQTLGLDNEGIIDKLEHLTIDGVYVDKVERIRGGGSLSLTEGNQLQKISLNRSTSHSTKSHMKRF